MFRTPLHCAASCNSVHLCKLLVESGAAIFATTISDVETAADKCEEMEDGYTQCSQFLYGEWCYIERHVAPEHKQPIAPTPYTLGTRARICKIA